MDEKTLKSKKLAELKEIAKAMGLKGITGMKKAELLELLIREATAQTEEPAKKETSGKEETSIVKVKKKPKAKPVKRKEKKAEEEAEQPKADQPQKNDTQADSEHAESEQAAADEPKGRREMKPDGEGKYEVDGILELSDSGFGFLRFENFLTSDEDIYVSPTQIRRFNLKTRDRIDGIARKPRSGEKFGALLFVGSVNGDEPGVARTRPDFEDLTPIFPNERISLEDSPTDLSTRLIDLVAPIGKGQ